MAQFGSAFALGAKGRRFKSCHPDQMSDQGLCGVTQGPWRIRSRARARRTIRSDPAIGPSALRLPDIASSRESDHVTASRFGPLGPHGSVPVRCRERGPSSGRASPSQPSRDREQHRERDERRDDHHDDDARIVETLGRHNRGGGTTSTAAFSPRSLRATSASLTRNGAPAAFSIMPSASNGTSTKCTTEHEHERAHVAEPVADVIHRIAQPPRASTRPKTPAPTRSAESRARPSRHPPATSGSRFVTGCTREPTAVSLAEHRRPVARACEEGRQRRMVGRNAGSFRPGDERLLQTRREPTRVAAGVEADPRGRTPWDPRSRG